MTDAEDRHRTLRRRAAYAFQWLCYTCVTADRMQHAFQSALAALYLDGLIGREDYAFWTDRRKPE